MTGIKEALMDKTGGQLSITNTDPGLAMIFATYPAPFVSVLGAIPEQVLKNIYIFYDFLLLN